MNDQLVNIHTHQKSTHDEYIELISLFHNASIPEGKHFSIGAHPWHAEKNTAQALVDEIYPKIRFAFAIGECGLDRSSSVNWDKQVELFRLQIELSENQNKPLIIHAVRSYPDIIALRKIHNAKQAWIVHGYQGNIENMQQLVEHGIYISFGADILRGKPNLDACIRTIPKEKLFFETDEAAINIQRVYEYAARLLDMDLEALISQVHSNFKALSNDN